MIKRTVNPQIIHRTLLPQDFSLSTWESVLPYFEKLSAQEIIDLNSLEDFCKNRSELESYLSENFAWRYIKMSCDNQNENLQKAISNLSMKSCPMLLFLMMLGIKK